MSFSDEKFLEEEVREKTGRKESHRRDILPFNERGERKIPDRDPEQKLAIKVTIMIDYRNSSDP